MSNDMMKNLHGNKIKWDELIEQERAKDVKPEEEVLTEGGSTNSVETSVVSESITAEPVKSNNFLTVPEWNCQQRIGRRHSMPLSLQAAAPEISRTILRRESLPVSEKKHQTMYQSGLLEEEEEEDSSNLDRSTSFISSASDDARYKDESDEERVLSSENLLPEPSITSITTVTEASRLSAVLSQGQSPQLAAPKSQLTRQQTFPPLQPYVRQRYLSATVEMSRFMNVESNSSSKSDISTKCGINGDSSVDSGGDTHCGTKNGCRTPPFSKTSVLRESNRSSFNHSDYDKQNNGKRETASSSHDKGVKVAKLWDDKLLGNCEKENLDPRKVGTDLDIDSSLFHASSFRKNSTQVRRKLFNS